jgi:hypothetical protein
MIKKSKILSLCVALSAILGGATQAYADITYTPISSTVSTVQSPYMYISINDVGTLGNGDYNPGIQHDPTGTGTFFDGKDYLTPGTPFEGFYVNATNETSSYSIGNNNSSGGDFSATGPLTNSSTLHDADISWVGSNSTVGMTVTNRYTFSDTAQYIKIRTTLTADQNLTGVQFLRTLDPDQDSSSDLGSSSTSDTTNTLGLTTSSGKVIPASDAAVGAGAVRPDLKVIIYTNSSVPHAAGISHGWSEDPADFLGATPLDDGYGDNTIGIAYNVGDLATGSSTDLVYYYLFTDSAEVLDSIIREIAVAQNFRQYIIEHDGNQNAQSIGGILDTLNAASETTDEQKALIDNFEMSGEANYVTNATALSGEIHGALAAEIPLSSIWLKNAVSDATFRSSTSESCIQPGRGIWFATGRSWDRWYGDSRASGIYADRNQFAFGYDLMSDKQIRAGLGGFYAEIDVDGANRSNGNAEKKLVFAYGQYKTGKILFDGILAGGSTRWATNRSVTLNGITEEFSTSESGFSGLASLSVSMPMDYSSVSIQPYASAMLIHEERGSASEGDSAAALTLPGYSVNGGRLSLGITLASACRNPLKSSTTFKVGIEGGIDSQDLANPHVEAEIAGIPYDIVTPSVSQGYFQTKLEGTARLAKNSYCYADYTGMFREGAHSHGVELGVRVTF